MHQAGSASSLTNHLSEVPLKMVNVASKTLVNDIFLDTVSWLDSRTEKTSWRIEGPPQMTREPTYLLLT